MGNLQLTKRKFLSSVPFFISTPTREKVLMKAYQLLKQEGYIITDRRNGATVQCAGGKKRAVEKKVKKELELLAAEAKIAGISQEEFLALCRETYGEQKNDLSVQKN